MKRSLRKRYGRSRLSRLWVVRNPGPTSTLQDIVFDFDPSSDMLENYMRGGSHGSWSREGHDLYTSEAEAKREARRRLAARGG